ncbi:MAG: dihydropteroate synthase [Nitrosopumilaceae archaeon]|jgi:dihydropteroate synthase|uniref:Dihydropteroate synthase n=3 Tax=Candidatus Nitrosomaritimum aestuariumsis TaxID=3342354 RepID=A0AC60W033_9ARCH|nr:dihydropteroate synthase [Nitrosopumilaceae archaeon]MBA4460694.1 dihydropteroate synthase [Nitrosopumilaceae archaeon]MBA4461837.1 dihydropteroate synthase [Nitrosopumilaceae archaeon]MBA4463977.1 dihydropteroate synthase [Nitrosopumilaceae archaeon]
MTKLGNVGIGGTNPVRIMGILNTSSESFYKKSIKTSKQSISNTIKEMELDGADFIDVGGMSTAPYLSTLISEKEEFSRISKAIKIIQNVSNLPISVDTCRAAVANSALELGVDIINDISGLKYDSKMIKVISNYNPSLILCAFDTKLVTGDPVSSTKTLLRQSLAISKKVNFPSNKIVLDPAIGFFRKSGEGKFFTKIRSDWYKRDLKVLQNLKSIKEKYPLLISVSNKSVIGKILQKENPSDRLFGSIAAEVVSVLNGADIIRTHNVSETKDAVLVASKLSKRNKGL